MQKKSVILLDIFHEDFFPGRLEVEAWGPGLSESKEKFHC